MKLSVLDLIPIFEGVGPDNALEQAVRLARRVEELGFHRYWVAEHHDMERLACTAPEVLLAHIGANTRRIRIGSGALLLPHYKPIKVTEAFHMLATLYRGRVDLGIGRAPGGSAHVSMALSGNFLENVRQMPESLQALMELLSNRFQVEGQPVMARPIPSIPPEVWILGTNHRSASYAAQFGTGYVFGQFMSDQDGVEMLEAYRRGFQPSHLVHEARAIVAVGVICADTEEEALELARQAAALFKSAETKEVAEVAAPSNGRKQLVGTPEQVKRQLVELQHRFGVDEFLVVSMIPHYEKRLRSYELLGQAML
jgi:luciferase family oxidoreductase group 1